MISRTSSLLTRTLPGGHGILLATLFLLVVMSGKPVLGGLVLFIYGVFRGAYFHPATSSLFRSGFGYAQWLEVSPWKPGKALPAGPLLPTVQDGVLLLLVTFGTGASWSNLSTQLTAVSAGYALVLMAIMALTYFPSGAFYLGILIGTLPLVKAGSGVLLVYSSVLLLMASLLSLQHLERFPWKISKSWRLAFGRALGNPTRHLGWPFQIFSGHLESGPFSYTYCAGLAILIAWWNFTFALLLNIEPPSAPKYVVFEALPLVVIAVVLRITLYIGSGWLPPLRITQRLTSLRLIFPRYDIVFLAPLLALLAVLVPLDWLMEYGVDEQWHDSITVLFGLLICFTVPPSYRHWKLTSPGRYDPESICFTAPELYRSLKQSSVPR